MGTEVDVVERAEDEIPSSDNTPGPHIRIRVIDNGTGMDQETQKRIFEPFFTTKEVGKGTGLGLSTVFGTVRQHRGWIECESEAGAGSTFLINLPIATREEGEEEQVEVESIPRGTETILIIEDEKMVRRSTMLLLERCGYTVLWGADGLEGLEVFQRRRDEIALVLLDLSMPRMSGQEVLEQLQRIESGVKVIIFTGYAARKDQFKGAVDLIQKPFAIETLTRKIRAALDH